MPIDPLKHMGYCLKKARHERHLTQEQLAKMACLSIRSVAKIENGIMNPSFEVLSALIRVLNISANHLFYTDLATEDRETDQLARYYISSNSVGRKLIMKTAHSIAEETGTD